MANVEGYPAKWPSLNVSTCPCLFIYSFHRQLFQTGPYNERIHMAPWALDLILPILKTIVFQRYDFERPGHRYWLSLLSFSSYQTVYFVTETCVPLALCSYQRTAYIVELVSISHQTISHAGLVHPFIINTQQCLLYRLYCINTYGMNEQMCLFIYF